MKLTRKLIPAFVMLLVSAVLMSTASFAWFAMNETVEATGMKVTADAEFIFLEIKGTEDGETYKTTGTGALDAKLFPVAHKSFEDFIEDDADIANLAEESNWYYQFSSDPTKADAAEDSDATPVDEGKFDKFVASTTYQIKLHEGMLNKAYDVHVSAIKIPASKGITVIVAGANGYQELSATAETIAFNADNVLFDEITTSAVTVTVYIFINGADENVYTNNIAELTGSVEFSLTAYTANQG